MSRPLDLDGDPGPPIDPRDKRILVVYLFPALGDALLLAPAVKALCDRGASVDVLLRESAARIWRLLDLPARVRTIPESALSTPYDLGEHYDVAIDLTRRFDADGRAWVQASGAPVRLGWVGREESNPPGLTFGTEDFRVASERHWSRYQVLPMRCLGVVAPDYSLEWNIPKSVASGPRVPHMVVVPGSRQANKVFKPTAYGHAAARFVASGGRATIVGAPNERALLETVAKACDGEIYDGSDLERLVALVQSADVVLTNDTGPMHIAFLSGVPTVAVFTQMSPLVWGPPEPGGPNIVIRVEASMQRFSDEVCGDALANAVEHLMAHRT